MREEFTHRIIAPLRSADKSFVSADVPTQDRYFDPFKRFTGTFTPEWLESRSELSAGAKLTYARLCRFGNAGVVSNRTQADIARALSVAVRSVRNYLNELETFGVIETRRQGQGRADEYRFLKHPWMSDFRRDGAAARPAKVAGLERQSLPVFPPVSPPDPFSLSSLSLKERNLSEEFERLFSFYPRKEGKKAGFLTWRNTLHRGRPPPAASDLETAVKNYAVAVDGREPRYIRKIENFLGPAEEWREYLTARETSEERAVRIEREVQLILKQRDSR